MNQTADKWYRVDFFRIHTRVVLVIFCCCRLCVTLVYTFIFIVLAAQLITVACKLNKKQENDNWHMVCAQFHNIHLSAKHQLISLCKKKRRKNILSVVRARHIEQQNSLRKKKSTMFS